MMIVPMSELTMSLIRLMRRKGSYSALDHAWDMWNEATDGDEDGYCELAEQITGRLIVVRGNIAYFATKCDGCRDIEPDGEMVEAFGEQWCESCRDNYLYTCYDCGCYVHCDDYHSAYDEIYCDTCFQNFSWCEHCEEYYRDDDDHPCNNHCECEAPNLHFAFPANGRGTISEDERINITLPSGTIADEGISAIAYMVAGATENSHHTIRKVIDDIGPEWQTKRGNFTRRLSSGVWKALAVKLDNATISKVGNLARQHSTSDASWHVEVTRDLNLPAEDFYHEDSCWWQSYADSRCALKNWGGIGLRSFHGDDLRNGGVSGRAWVQPLDQDLKPTHQTIGAHAYIVYNGYGALDGYTPARIVAHMAGMTYKKVELSAPPQYVNSGYGYLVADEQTCSQTTTVSYYYHKHSHLDAPEHHA